MLRAEIRARCEAILAMYPTGGGTTSPAVLAALQTLATLQVADSIDYAITTLGNKLDAIYRRRA